MQKGDRSSDRRDLCTLTSAKPLVIWVFITVIGSNVPYLSILVNTEGDKRNRSWYTWVVRRARWEIFQRRPVDVGLRWTLSVAEPRRRQARSWAKTRVSRSQRTCRDRPRRCQSLLSAGDWRCRRQTETDETGVRKCWRSSYACCPTSWSVTRQRQRIAN